jgi:hypothetical protein
VDEWTVMILYNDVQHIEEERKKAEKLRAEKEKTRQVRLLVVFADVSVLLLRNWSASDAASANPHS